MLTLWVVLVQYKNDGMYDPPIMYTFWADSMGHARSQYKDAKLDSMDDVRWVDYRNTHIPYMEGN